MRDRNRDQYENDPNFHAVADTAYAIMQRGDLTAEELRRAVMLGAMMYEEQNIRPVTLVRGPDGEFRRVEALCAVCHRDPTKPGHAQCSRCLQRDRALGDGPE